MAIWTTPPATLASKELSLGEVNFGVESRMFVFAYQSSDTSGKVIDTSIPAYNKLVDFTEDELTKYSKDYNFLVLPNDETIINTTDVIMKYKDPKGVVLDSGLRISSNGQVVGSLQIPDQQKNLIFKVQYIDPPTYAKGIMYRAYCHVNYNGRLYRLRAGAPIPFTPDVDIPEAQYWEDLGKYTPKFSVRPTYVKGSTYSSGDYVVHGDSLFQLGNKNTFTIKAATEVPDPEYWMVIGDYSVDRFEPELYDSTKTFTTNNGADGVYVQYARMSYKLRLELPFTPDPDDYSPNLAEWDLLGPVCDEVYTVGKMYVLKDTRKYNNKVYQLVNTLPFKATADSPDTDFWANLGKYANSVPAPRIFRIIINTQKGSMIEFETKPTLHNLRIGEQVGELFINDIIAASGSLATYTVTESMLPTRGKPMVMTNGYYPFLPKGLSITADGRMCGRPKGPEGKYFFDVQAQNSVGLTKYQRFYIDIIPGYTTSTFSCTGKLSQVYEREWYKMIASPVFDKVSVYRASDPNYGLRTKPEILFKDNILGNLEGTRLTFDTTISYLKTKMYQEPIMCRVGNIRFRTALDVNGTPLYDYVYKELVPLSSYVTYDTRGYITPPRVPLLDHFKQFLVDTLASDDDNLSNKLAYIQPPGKAYFDACQLWQTNPSPFAGVSDKDVFPTLPIAYLAPGEGQRLIDASTEDDMLRSMFYNKTIAVETMVFKHHTDEFDREVSITLKSR